VRSLELRQTSAKRTGDSALCADRESDEAGVVVKQLACDVVGDPTEDKTSCQQPAWERVGGEGRNIKPRGSPKIAIPSSTAARKCRFMRWIVSRRWRGW